MNKLDLSLLQYDIQWENKTANQEKIEKLLERFKGNSDIILLPEMFSTGFTMSPENVAETSEGDTVKWMKEVASKYSSALAGSIVAEEGGQYYNRFYYVYPTGEYTWYDKKHLFSHGRENQHYSSGGKQLILEYKGWTIMPFVCYDLRFPVWMRNPGNVDLYLGVANWPDSRVNAWDLLLRGRAIENQAYVAGVNRIGEQPGSLNYNGHSVVISYDGEVLAFSEKAEKLIHYELSKEKLEHFRKSFRFLDDKDEFTIVSK